MNEIVRLGRQLSEMEHIVAEGDGGLAVRVPSVSGWSVAQQIDHVLRAAEGTLARVLERPQALPRGLTLAGRLVLGLGWFPRGVARSPRFAEGQDCPCAELTARISQLRGLLARLAGDAELLACRDPVVKHPYFGGLDARNALRSVVVHTAHHLAIVRDLRRAARR